MTVNIIGMGMTRHDDIDNTVTGEEVKTYKLSFDGKTAEIDLGPASLKGLEKALEPYFKAGRVSGSTAAPTTRAPRAKVKEGYTNKDAREWARERGGDLASKAKSDVGALHGDIVKAFNEAH